MKFGADNKFGNPAEVILARNDFQKIQDGGLVVLMKFYGELGCGLEIN